MPNRKVAFKDYKINENSPSVELTMEALGINREEAIKLMREMNYKVDFPKKN